MEQQIIRDYPGLTQALAKVRRALGYSQLAFDDRVGLAEGHTAKIEAGYRGLGPMTLPHILQALGCVLILAPVRSVVVTVQPEPLEGQIPLPIELPTLGEMIATTPEMKPRNRRKAAP